MAKRSRAGTRQATKRATSPARRSRNAGRGAAPRAGKATRGRAAKAAAKRSAPTPATARRTIAKKKTAARAAAARKRRRPPSPPPSRLAAAATLVRGAAAGAVAAIAQRLPWTTDESDPIVLLEADHRRFEDLLAQGEATTGRAVKGRADLLDTLTTELNIHEMIEEKVLYPALEAHAEAREIVLEGFQEHHVADLIVRELRALATRDERWGAKFKVLKENIEHHIKEEEHEMFRTARAVLSRDELHDLGARMKAMKAEHGR